MAKWPQVYGILPLLSLSLCALFLAEEDAALGCTHARTHARIHLQADQARGRSRQEIRETRASGICKIAFRSLPRLVGKMTVGLRAQVLEILRLWGPLSFGPAGRNDKIRGKQMAKRDKRKRHRSEVRSQMLHFSRGFLLPVPVSIGHV